ncbi:MAG TPA: hypothetical protein VNI52_00340 [Sphingobacteriaceae bacterium]|nr:hypothetical protein [Sphingobacteriaceae bacterium]
MKKLNFKLGGIGEMLTKEQMKKVVGGYEGAGRCSTGSCTINVSGHGEQPGGCESNSANKCVCKALDYSASALDEGCVK